MRSIASSAGLLVPAPRRHFPTNSCFSTKQNTFGVGFTLRGPPAKQQGLGSQRQPRPSLPSVDPRAKVEKGQRYFAEQRCICAAVGSPRSVEVSRMQLSEPRFEPWVRWGLRAEVPIWLGGIAGACALKAFSCQLLLLPEGEHI